jgi:hypothetical protein
MRSPRSLQDDSMTQTVHLQKLILQKTSLMNWCNPQLKSSPPD